MYDPLSCSRRGDTGGAMKVAVPREIREGERRVALVPESCRKLVKAGIEVTVESGAGSAAFFPDDAYREAGASIGENAASVLGWADFILKVQAPAPYPSPGAHEVDAMREGAMLLCTLMPSRHPDVVERLAARRITSFATDRIPRITRAQSMDTLSSMANISGYMAVLVAATALPRYFPMLTTAAGTVLPAKVFVVGAGGAGLSAIATARRLGASVEATDTRPAAKEQVESLGARFVGVDTAEVAQDSSGYARELSEDFYKKQAEFLADRCAASDVVITTALIGGRVHDHRALLHPAHHLGGDELGRLHAADQRRRDDHVRRRAPVREKLRLLPVELLRKFPGVSGGCLLYT